MTNGLNSLSITVILKPYNIIVEQSLSVKGRKTIQNKPFCDMNFCMCPALVVMYTLSLAHATSRHVHHYSDDVASYVGVLTCDSC